MGVVVVETNYRRFDPVAQGDQCESCSSGCKTSCARLLSSEERTVLNNKRRQATGQQLPGVGRQNVGHVPETD